MRLFVSFRTVVRERKYETRFPNVTSFGQAKKCRFETGSFHWIHISHNLIRFAVRSFNTFHDAQILLQYCDMPISWFNFYHKLLLNFLSYDINYSDQTASIEKLSKWPIISDLVHVSCDYWLYVLMMKMLPETRFQDTSYRILSTWKRSFIQ